MQYYGIIKFVSHHSAMRTCGDGSEYRSEQYKGCLCNGDDYDLVSLKPSMLR